MASTLERTYCPTCNKKNLCHYLTENGFPRATCKTAGCTQDGLEPLPQKVGVPVKDTSFVQNIEFKSIDYLYRGISPETCDLLGIQVAVFNDQMVYRYKHKDLDGTAKYKIRWYTVEGEKKKFTWEDGQAEDMFALHLCTDFTKPLYITEGNEDTASLWEIGKQACSVLSSGNEVNNVNSSLEYLNKFPEIILCIDNDKAGKIVTKNILKLLQHKLVKVVDFSPFKDANECLLAGSNVFTLQMCIDGAKEITPSGMVQGNQLDFNKLKHQTIKAIPLPWPKLQEAMQGLEYGCLYLFLAGTSTGKSTVLRELAYYYYNTIPYLKIANFFFEENEQVTPLAYLALHLNTPLGELRRSIDDLNEVRYQTAVKEVLDNDRLMFINRDFSKNIDNLLKNIEYLVSVKGYNLIIIDHISYIIGRTGTSKNGERIDIDNFIYKLQDIGQRLGCIILAVSHVNESDSKTRWDQGQAPNIYSGRGSRALAQVPDGIIGLARNIENEYSKSVLSLYNLKNRWFGQTGKVDELIYVDKTGRLILKQD